MPRGLLLLLLPVGTRSGASAGMRLMLLLLLVAPSAALPRPSLSTGCSSGCDHLQLPVVAAFSGLDMLPLISSQLPLLPTQCSSGEEAVAACGSCSPGSCP